MCTTEMLVFYIIASQYISMQKLSYPFENINLINMCTPKA